MNNKYELIKFEDGEFSLDVNVSPDEDTVWLTKDDISLLFSRDRTVISRHIKNIYNEKELNEETSCAKIAHQIGGQIHYTTFFNLDVIISVGYRVKSNRGVLFRRWANKILKQYLLKGSVINEERCLSCASNIISLQNKVESIESKMNDMANTIYLDNSKAFYEGDIVEPYTFLRHLFFLAKYELIITDSYADNYLISILKDINVNITIITSSNSYLNKLSLPNNIKVIHNNHIHGRYIFIDEKLVYALDNSFNNIGKKKFVIMRLDNINKDMLLKTGE